MSKRIGNKPQNDAHQTVSMNINVGGETQSLRIGFTDQRLTAFGGMAVWSGFLHKLNFRDRLEKGLPHTPTSPNAYPPADVALGFCGGVLCGADKYSRVAYLASDPALPEVLGIEAIPSQSTLSRFFADFGFKGSTGLNGLHRWCVGRLNSLAQGHTLDLDSWCLLHEDGHQEGVRTGHTPQGFKKCHHALLGVLAEAKLVAGFWLRPGNVTSGHNVVRCVEELLASLPAHIRIGLVRADSGFYNRELFTTLEQQNINYIVVCKLNCAIQKICRHEDSCWTATEVPGTQVQEIDWSEEQGLGRHRRMLVLRHRLQDRPDAGGKPLLDLPGYRYQALITNLPRWYSPVAVWRQYLPRGDAENRIRELGRQFGIRGFCSQSFWGTEATCHLCIAAYNLCVLLQRELGALKKVELNTLRTQLFLRAGVWSRAQGRATLRLAVKPKWRLWWLQVLEKLQSRLPPSNCNAVELVT